ncbi:hypothetical protein J2W21_001398 [Sinomonas atrocyanea]|uniref:hypothetical protein n=1 Tax=Sinomonas atrocyanea TaxID=37927 RepID=UPI002788B897|nr:hypothetical protein [Sinomonas atrocyanea]MDP9883904.1 hypothetical protein [Sinomonas atrocyanea]
MDLAAIAAELYTLTPRDFTGARNDRAKELRREGQRALAQRVARLAKPSVSAWAVNALAVGRAEALQSVVALGAQLREAQEDLDPGRLRALAKDRTQLLPQAVAAARATAHRSGIAVSDAAAAEIEQTLRAAMSDALASAAVQSGLLLHALEGNGLEPVDLSGAVAVPEVLDRPPGTAEALPVGATGHNVGEAHRADGGRSRDGAGRRRTGDAKRKAEQERQQAEQLRREERAEAEADRDEAAQALDEAQAELAGTERDAADAAARARRLADELDRLRARITELEDDVAAAEREAAAAERARKLASRLVDRELRAVSKARERLAALD